MDRHCAGDLDLRGYEVINPDDAIDVADEQFSALSHDEANYLFDRTQALLKARLKDQARRLGIDLPDDDDEQKPTKPKPRSARAKPTASELAERMNNGTLKTRTDQLIDSGSYVPPKD